MNRIESLGGWLRQLTAALEPTQLQQLNRRLAAELRTIQRQRILAQTEPSGTAFAPRKPQRRRTKTGPMYTRRILRAMTVRSSAHHAEVGWSGPLARIARVSQSGGTDIVNRRTGQRARYLRRELLGITDADLQRLEPIILDHLSQLST